MQLFRGLQYALGIGADPVPVIAGPAVLIRLALRVAGQPLGFFLRHRAGGKIEDACSARAVLSRR